MTKFLLFDRDWRVTVGGINSLQGVQIPKPIDINFSVKKTLRPEPNQATLKIFNLSPDTRKRIESSFSSTGVPNAKVPVLLEAGYSGALAQVFLGELRAGMSTTEGPDIVTELTNGDGEKEMSTVRVNVAIGAGSPIEVVLREIVKTLGVGAGNVDQAVALFKAKGLLTFSAKAQYLKGNAADHLTDLTKGAGLEWSVQNGALQVLPLGLPLAGAAVRLSEDSGLIGSPSVDSKGVLNFTSLLIPGLQPGTPVVVDAEHVKGNYRVEVCEYVGDSMGEEWYVKGQGRRF